MTRTNAITTILPIGRGKIPRDLRRKCCLALLLRPPCFDVVPWPGPASTRLHFTLGRAKPYHFHVLSLGNHSEILPGGVSVLFLHVFAVCRMRWLLHRLFGWTQIPTFVVPKPAGCLTKPFGEYCQWRRGRQDSV